jgi:hypothetical protein
MRIKKQSRASERIQEAVSHLLIPPLESLQELLIERRENVVSERNRIEKLRVQIREDGFEAAARLMLPEADVLQNSERSYFEHIAPVKGEPR